jgi:thiamine-monophosphate kinase
VNDDERLNPDAVPPWLASLWPRYEGSPVIAGINDDDCAVLEWGGELLVVTTDFLNARPMALELGVGGLGDLGRLVVAANLSDLCGSGAAPRALLIGVTMPYGSPSEDFRELMLGVRSEASRWAVPVVGGDTKLGAALALFGVAIGAARSRSNLFLKNGGLEGDALWTSGPLGSVSSAALGLSRGDMTPEWNEWAREVVCRPQVPVAQSRALSDAGVGHGGIDVSDGLGADLRRMCEASCVGATVEVSNVPVAAETRVLADRLGVPAWAFAFASGGDFQFLVSTAPEAARAMSGLGFRRIGTLTRDPALQLCSDARVFAPMPDSGHSDARGLSFVDEIGQLLAAATSKPTESS